MSQTYSDVYYVKLRKVDQVTGKHEWLGWLSYNPKLGEWTTYSGKVASLPDADTLPVQWLQEIGPGGEQAWYLFACAYPLGGGRLLHFHDPQNAGLYWTQPVAKQPLQDFGFALESESFAGTNERVLRRTLDGKSIYTGMAAGSLVWGDETDGAQVTFEFVLASQYGKPHENWMHDYNRLLGDRAMTEITLPGSHDAAMYDLSQGIYNDSSKTQDLSIYQQLQAGSRYLDLRAWRASDGEWWMIHGSKWAWAWANVTLADVVGQIKLFLDFHPGEVVLASLLLEDSKNGDAFTGGRMAGWDRVYDELHPYCLQYNSTPGAFSRLTPNALRKLGKNFLLFTWGTTVSWQHTAPDGTHLTVTPWPAHADDGGPYTEMDLQGAYDDDSDGSAADILEKYNSYTPTSGVGWIVHTNTPFGGGHSLWTHHLRNTPELARYFNEGTMGPPRANIVNIDYVGGLVPPSPADEQADLVWSAIWSNFATNADAAHSSEPNPADS